MSAVAINPFLETFRSFGNQSLHFKCTGGELKTYLKGKILWEISKKQFSPGFSISHKNINGQQFINAHNLVIKGTQLKFSLKLIIFDPSGENASLSIPEFDFEWQGNFKQWLLGTESIQQKCLINQTITSYANSDQISLNGIHSVELFPNWELTFSANNKVSFNYDGINYHTNTVHIHACRSGDKLFSTRNTTQITLPEFAGWNSFVSNIHFNDVRFTSVGKSNADVQINIPHSSPQNRSFLVNTSAQDLILSSEDPSLSEIQFNKIFYYAEYLNNTSKSYLAASLPEKGVWINNSVGAFKLENNSDLPDFEAFGYGNKFNEVIIEPRLRAFKPIIEHAVSVSTVFQDPKKVRIKQSQVKLNTTTSSSKPQDPPKSSTRKPVKKATFNPREPETSTPQRKPTKVTFEINVPQDRPQKPTRKVQKNQPQLNLEFDKIKFKPKKAISIKVLRPEDMVLLEFVFHNFNFTNKGQSPFLELDNDKKKGIVEVYFQSQHTLEEAWFEATNIPTQDDDPAGSIQLPAKHLRARKTRLVYELPAHHEGFPLIMDELLDWSKFKLRVHPRAWIKIPVLKKVRKPSRVTLDKKSPVQPNKNIKYLETPSTDYGIKLAQSNKVRASNYQVYNENEVSKVLSVQSANSVKTSFNTKTIKKISWKVAPIPALSTSIEAPTLMYISPNQTNDFHHKTKVSFRDTKEFKVVEGKVGNANFRVLDPLTTNAGEVTELWHTRLGVKLKNGKTSVTALPHLKTIRALWADEATTDYTQKGRNKPFMASLDANNRQKLVHTTSNYTDGFEPFPVPVNDLMLTSLGAYLDWHAIFDVPTPQDNYLNIIEWEHIATLGRDHFVKIVEEGYLFPFGHRAAVVKITERKFHPQTKAALNRQRMFIVVLEKEVLYSKNDPKGDFIEFPFQAVRIETNKTPNIENPANSTLTNVPDEGGDNTTYNFYIKVAGKGFLFDIIATDKEGIEHPFRMPLVFMENFIARDKKLMEDVIDEYRGKNSNDYNKLYNETDFYGREVAYAKSLVEGDTAFETEMIKFDAQVYPAPGKGSLKFHPRMKEAKVFVKQIDELTGVREAATIGLEDDNNDGDVFARVISDSVVDFSGGSDKSGGFMVPNMGVSGLSKLQGPVSGKLDDMKSMLFSPDEFFGELTDLPVAKIFGVINIFDLLFGDSGSPFDLGGSMDGMKNAVSGIRNEIEDIKTEILYLENLAEETQQSLENEINSLKQTVKAKVDELVSSLNDAVPRIPNLKSYLTEEAFYAEYKWQPKLEGEEIKVFPNILHVNVVNPSTALSITTKFEKPFDTSKSATMNGVARFDKFEIDIVPLLAIKFNYLEFRTGSSVKTDVKVDIDKDDPIKFKGVLNFVNNLQSIIPSDGFSDSGPYIKIKPTGVTAGFDIAIPNVEVGICMISNISLGANVTLPFTGAPLTMGFNFCRRENPFMLTISCFGGGGYFMMVTTLDGLQSVEAAFEFGAAMSLNVGVASGGVSAMGGFYFKMEIIEGEKTTTLTGYLRLNGHLSILGIISLSLEFYLAFSAVIIEGKVQKLEGLATLKVKVEVLFFSKTVSVTVRRELKGADADPKFIEMIDQDDWQEYCLAFAS